MICYDCPPLLFDVMSRLSCVQDAYLILQFDRVGMLHEPHLCSSTLIFQSSYLVLQFHTVGRRNLHMSLTFVLLLPDLLILCCLFTKDGEAA
jgi:DNA polymerase III psi subunit